MSQSIKWKETEAGTSCGIYMHARVRMHACTHTHTNIDYCLCFLVNSDYYQEWGNWLSLEGWSPVPCPARLRLFPVP